jgi:GDPmannose 4,6-dehydratase
MKIAFITGINGQDGFYLAQLLLGKGYKVHGLARTEFLDSDLRKGGVVLHVGDMLDRVRLRDVLLKVSPTEIYNLAAQASVVASWDHPEYTCEVDYLGAVRLLECVRELGLTTRMFQASSMVMFGKTPSPFSEDMHFKPTSPYGIAKLAAHLLCQSYRAKYNIFVACGILFHHESPRRGEAFVTRKISKGVAEILAGTQKDLHLGDLDAQCDWSDARDIVQGMWEMLQAQEADDYILASGKSRFLREIVALFFESAGLDWTQYVVSEATLMRPWDDQHRLVVSVEKARLQLGWKVTRSIEETFYEMLEADLARLGLPPTKLVKGKERKE